MGFQFGHKLIAYLYLLVDLLGLLEKNVFFRIEFYFKLSPFFSLGFFFFCSYRFPASWPSLHLSKIRFLFIHAFNDIVNLGHFYVPRLRVKLSPHYLALLAVISFVGSRNSRLNGFQNILLGYS